MTDPSATAALAAKQSKDGELVQLKMQVDRLRADLTPGPSAQKKLRKACTDFEAVFISKLWEQMRATVPKGGILSSPQEEMYRSMFDRDFAEKLASDGGIGLGDMLYGQLKDRIKSSGKGVGADGASAAAAAAPLAAKQAPLRPLEPRPLKPLERPAPAQPQGQAPARPAAVPGDVMDSVEALARRIETAYDRRMAQAEAGRTGSRLATIG